MCECKTHNEACSAFPCCRNCSMGEYASKSGIQMIEEIKADIQNIKTSNAVGPRMAERDNKHKLRYSIIPMFFSRVLAEVGDYDGRKYADHNWKKGAPYSQYYDCAQRHIYKFFVDKEPIDMESGCHHLAHAAWNLLACIWVEKNEKGIDDRDAIS